MNYLARIRVTLKPAVNDPAGQTVLGALRRMGYAAAGEVRMGKYLELRLTAASEAAAREQVDEMCHRLLANPVIEDYHFDLAPLPDETA